MHSLLLLVLQIYLGTCALLFFFSCTPVLVLTTCFQLIISIFQRKSGKWYTVLVLRTCRKNEKAESHISKILQDRHKNSSIITTFTPVQQCHNRNCCKKQQNIAISWSHWVSYDKFAALKITASRQHSFTFQGSQKFLSEPANSYFIRLLILKRKLITLSTQESSMPTVFCTPHFSRADFARQQKLLDRNTMCLVPQNSLFTLPSS